MLRSTLCLVTCWAVCVSCKSGDETASEPPAEKREPAPAAEPAPAPPSEPAPPAPSQPEPTTPEEIDTARKAAMMEGRDNDVIKYCEMGGVESGKSDPQVLLGCALAACRLDDAPKAKAWSKTLPKPLRKQAVEICLANQVVL